MGRRLLGLKVITAMALAVVLAVTGCGGASPPITPLTPDKQPACSGSGLANDPSGSQCFTPASPAQACANAQMVTSPAVTLPSQTTHDAEMAVAVDPRGNGVAYVATIQADTSPQAGTTGGTCIVRKHIAVFRFAQDDPAMPNAGPHWFAMPGLETIPRPTDEWATDPWLSVGGDGTLYLTFLRNRSRLNDTIMSTDPNHPTLTACEKGVDSADSAIELWIAPPDPADPTRILPLQPAPLVVATPTIFSAPSPTIEGTTRQADFPKLIASRTVPGLVFMTGRDNIIVPGSHGDFIAAYQRNAAGQFERKAHLPIAGAELAPVLAVDDAGFVYAIVINNLDENSPTFHLNPVVKQLRFDGSTLIENATASPPVVSGITYGNASAVNIPTASTTIPNGVPSIAVTRLGNSSDNVVYLAFDVFDGNNNKEIELVAANTKDLSKWTSPVLSQQLIPSFTPIISVDGKSNVLDLLYFGFDRTRGQTAATMTLAVFFSRYDAGKLARIAGPVQLGTIPGALPLDLPIRHGPVDDPGGPVPLNSLFVGEYMGLATSGLTAIAGFPNLVTSPRNLDLGIVQVRSTCTSAVTLANRDGSWECDCTCSTGSGTSKTVSMVGCAPVGSNASSVCGTVCNLKTPCGVQLTCTGAPFCRAAGSPGRLISANGCAMSDGVALGSPPANSSDFAFASAGASTATLTMSGQTATTSLTGPVYFNASTSPPTAGAVAEIAWLKVQPGDVFVGGSVGQFVRNMKLVHMNRLQGIFTDSRHFAITPGAAEFVLTLQTEPIEGEISSPISFRASNPNPMIGTVDLQTGTFVLDGTAGDGAGSSLTIHVDAPIVSRPADSDHDGIIDAVDKCPGATVGPDITPPQFTFVPSDITTSSCTGVSLGVAKATDPCGVTVTNNAPAKFPLGTTLVTWTARDGAGNVTRATQMVTAVMGNSTSCCPAGSKIIVGTSNNDVLVGTSGPDCILGLGGQDTITGGGGDDVIWGGDGDDIISGQGGNDRLYGGSGQDQISGGPGNDIIDGGDGDDRLNGDDGNDVIFGGQGQDICFGGIGNDTINGGTGDDQLHGDDGDDRLSGEEGNDRLFGENGDDVLTGESGDDQLDGGAGNNTLLGGSGHNICVDNSLSVTCENSDGD